MAIVLYLDMDSFFASCEELRNPNLKNKPVVVGTSDKEHIQRGVVESCNYIARKSGIKSAMPTSKAMTLNSKLEYIKGDHTYYERVSDRIMSLLKGYGFKTEVISVDEAAIELLDSTYQDAHRIAYNIKQKINEEIGLQCTIGVSPTKTLAKMACDDAKPNGLKVIKDFEVKQFLAQKQIDKIPGIGDKTRQRLNKIKINNISELAKADPLVLIDMFGEFGKELFLLANGLDTSKVEYDQDPLSIGRERTLEYKTSDIKEIEKTLECIAEEVFKEVKTRGVWFKTITAKVKYADFTERIKSRTFDYYSDSKELLLSNAVELINQIIKKGLLVRKVGIRVSGFIEAKRQKKLA